MSLYNYFLFLLFSFPLFFNFLLFSFPSFSPFFFCLFLLLFLFPLFFFFLLPPLREKPSKINPLRTNHSNKYVWAQQGQL